MIDKRKQYGMKLEATGGKNQSSPEWSTKRNIWTGISFQGHMFVGFFSREVGPVLVCARHLLVGVTLAHHQVEPQLTHQGDTPWGLTHIPATRGIPPGV